MNNNFTYIMTDGEFYKIGKSNNPYKRLCDFRTGNYNIELIAYGTGVTELYLHHRYSEYRVEYEWFNFNLDIVNEIVALINGQNQISEINNYKLSVIKKIDIIWRIKGFENYGYGTDKNLYNLKTNRKLKQCYNSGSIGYWFGKEFKTTKALKELIFKQKKEYLPF